MDGSSRRLRPDGRRARRSGMTLLEVLLAVFILGTCLLGIMQGMTACMETFRASAFVQQAVNVMALGEEAHPEVVENDPVSDLETPPDGSLLEGWTWERHCEEDEDEDGLWLVRVKVVKGRGGPGNEMETCHLRYLPDMEGSK